ncbi:hypothetical protein SEUCBS139899_002419 [Sporothrix eucalyptigena]|uniref:Galactose oxidase/kelch, beta-propeller n=1 Tax=Sporothrix eucalyptigena TaxID=1812306 RepID=A0ABP0B1I6_9PEZI
MAASPDVLFRGLVLGRHQPMIAPQAVLLAALLQLLPRVAAASSSSSSPVVFPYTPTTILVPSSNSSIIYLFSASAAGQVEFLSLNISSTLSSSSTSSLTTLTQGVPFLANSGLENTASTFTPTIRSDGSIFVYAGDCSSSASSSATVWTYNPSKSSAQWKSSSIALSSSQSGPWFLGSSTTFSNQIAPSVSNSTFYMYGGMCPTNETSTSSTTSTAAASSTSITASNWQGRATYSNQMLKLVPSSGTYTPSIVSSKGPPIAEAGFTFTSLSASQSNRSGIVTQSVNSVVLGGHTETAFVNMSTAAIWSLPQEAWSFVSIANPTSSSNTELAVVRKSSSATTSAPDSRSGHTAVLSEDGNSLVILGGWVGDVGQAADPQLAILQMGPDYGQWQWSIPSTQPSGSGMYGHGAALLPGNVMMVYGGYNISSTTSSTKLLRRQSSGGSGLMFYNLTSLSWFEEYTNPSYDTSTASPSTSKSSTSTSKIGLGVGLGLGIPLAILIIAILVRSCRRRNRQRRRRNEAVRALVQDHQQFLHGHDEMSETIPGGGINWGARDFYTGGHDPYNMGRRSLGFESLRGAKSSPAFPTYQSPNIGGVDEPRIPGPAFSSGRKPSRNVARGLYQPTTINDYESFLALGAAGGAVAGNSTNGIHPIYEADEEDDDSMTEKGKQRADPEKGGADSIGRSISPETEELTDPFMTPSTQSVNAGSANPMRSSYTGAFGPNTVNLNPFVRNTPSPEAGAAMARNVHGGMMASADAPGAGAGPLMPIGQDRDVQEWVSGLEIEDLLFSPPAPGAGAAIAASISPAPGSGPAQQRGRVSPVNTSRRLSLRSKASNNSSPTRSTFFGSGAAAAVAGAVAGVAAGWVGGDDEARTGSNLSDRSAFSFLSHTTSSRSRRGGAGVYGVVGDGKGASSDSSSASFNTAQSGFHSLRNEGPALLYGKGHKNGSSAGSSFGAASGSGGVSNNSGNSASGSVRGGAITPTSYSLNAPPTLPPLGVGPSLGEYGGAAAVMAPGVYGRKEREEDENDALTGSPSKQKGKRTWMGSIMRIFSSGSPANDNSASGTALDAANSSMGTGAQQGPNYRDMAHATLLRRKQGRSDWEADELREEENTAVGALRSGGRTASIGSIHGYSHGIGQGTGSSAGGPSGSGNIATGRRDGSGKSDEWDVEKAVQNRVVQVMFTMPRGEQLRVVNAEVEQEDDEADVGNVSQSIDPHDYSINTEVDHGQEDTDVGGLSAPPPPPVQQRPYHSYRSRSPLETTTAATNSANEQYRAMPPPVGLTSPIPSNIIDKQDEQLRQLHEALAESKRLLSTRAIEPWMLDAHDDDDDYDDDATFGEEEVLEDQAQAIPINKGKVVDVNWMDAGSVPSPLNTSSSAQRNNIKEDRESLATAAALARIMMSRPASTPEPVVTSAPPTPQPVQAKPPIRELTVPTKTLIAPYVTSSTTTAASTAPLGRTTPGPTTPTKSVSPIRSLAGTYKTPTKTISSESMSTNTSSSPSLSSRRSGRRGTLGGDTLLGSPAAAEAASTIRKPAGFVLNMVDRIETTSSGSERSA